MVVVQVRPRQYTSIPNNYIDIRYLFNIIST